MHSCLCKSRPAVKNQTPKSHQFGDVHLTCALEHIYINAKILNFKTADWQLSKSE